MSTVCLDPIQTQAATGSCLRRVLFISYQFPPVGGAGVQRPAKFVKYLHEFGWEATVLMPSNPSVPVFDESLLAELPDDLRFVKSRTWEPAYGVKQSVSSASQNSGIARRLKKLLLRPFRLAAGLLLQPDPQILWLPNALRSATDLLRRVPHDAIFATAPPYTDLLLGTCLKRRFGLPLVLDYRDEWDLSSQYLENSRKDWWSRIVQERMQRWALRHADAVVATTQSSANRLATRITQSGGRASAHCIYNGFDPSDLSAGNEADHPDLAPTGRFRIVYTGTLWNLTTIEPLARAVAQLRTDQPQLLSCLELIVVGRKTPAQKAFLEQMSSAGCMVRDIDYCDHHRATAWMQSADALCLLLSDVPGAERVVPGKLFEYLATTRPMLAIVPNGETAEIVRRFHPSGHCLPSDVPAITRWLCGHLALDRSVESNVSLSHWERVRVRAESDSDITQFTRRHLTNQLTDLLDELTVQKGPRS